MIVLTAILAALVAGVLVYEVLTIAAAWSYRRARPAELRSVVPISVLKPLKGVDEGLEENLCSFFAQQYSAFEILFAVQDGADPAVEIVGKLRHEFPAVPARLIITR